MKPAPTAALLAAAASTAGCDLLSEPLPDDCDDFESTAPEPEEVEASDTGWWSYCDDWYKQCVCDGGGSECQWICNG